MQYGLIGHPVGHSYSKVIHEMLGNTGYEITDVLPEQLGSFLEEKNYLGLNVTLPYKEVVLSYLDEIEPQAEAIGAVNTIINKDGRLFGYNTDYYGFRSLFLRQKVDVTGKKAIILGSGGTSKTVKKVLEDLGVRDIYRVSRTPNAPDTVDMAFAVRLGAEIVVNTTPVGMYPKGETHCIEEPYREDIYKNAEVCLDAVYRPLETPFIEDAKRRGIKAEGGLYMLVAQAVYGARLFLDKEIEEDRIAEIFSKMQEYLQGELHIGMTENLQGTVCVPPSKSYSHRHLILAAFAKKPVRLYGVGKSKDIFATMEGLRQFGAKIQVVHQTDSSQDLLVDGSGFLTEVGDRTIYCGESGSTLRFLLPIALLRDGKTRFVGERRLFERPMEVYESMCAQRRIFYKQEEGAIVVQGRLTGGDFEVMGGISSQFISGLMMSLPFTKQDSCIRILPPVESAPYIQMTAAVLRAWGISAEVTDNRIELCAGQEAVAEKVMVEKDYSNGAYVAAYQTLGHKIEILGLEGETLQGDAAFVEIFRRLKEEKAPVIAMEQTPDLVPIAMAVAACEHGGIFTGTRRLQLKESDRGRVMIEELSKFGISCVEEDNSIRVCAGTLQAPTEALFGHNDHRIVMALTVLLAKTGGRLRGFEAVRKSYPTYFSDLEKCGLRIESKES